MQEEWRGRLRNARTKLGLSQAELAEAAGVSPATMRAYETGRRKPRREHLESLMDALQLDRGWRNDMLVATGFAPEGTAKRPDDIDSWMFTHEEADAEIARYPWPAFVLTERAQVVAANPLAQLVWGVDMEREYPDPLERNLLAVASDPRFADRCVNWDEAVAVIVATFKGYHRQPESVDEPSPYFAAVLNRFLAGDPKYVGRFLKLWQEAPESQTTKIRWTYPVVWHIDGIGDMRFRGVTSAANESDGLSFNDWMPVDAASWEALERLRGGGG
jgi:transcriptional regulator with XRE-family HTH domain